MTVSGADRPGPPASRTVSAALASPADVSPPRTPHSVRRTSHVDMHVADDGWLTLDGGARDLRTRRAHEETDVLARATIRARVGPTGVLAEIDASSGGRFHEVDGLVGRSTRRGFRSALAELVPALMSSRSPLALLLDDVPVAVLISGYARLYRGGIDPDVASAAMQSDICAGWDEGGTMMRSVRAGLGVPVTIGPAAPRIDAGAAGEAGGWHEIDPLPVGSMRRRRLLDVTTGGAHALSRVTAMFRDTYVGPDGVETVLHEYALTASIDTATGLFTACDAVPRVLPWPECPTAAASARRLIGVDPAAVRDVVRRDFHGLTTCTHLNDLLRSLADIPLVTGRARHYP